MTVRHAFNWPGGKVRLAPWIIRQFPPHSLYVEPFFGSGAVFFRKERAGQEIINDLNGDVVNFYRVLREQPDELARQCALTPWARSEHQACKVPADDPLELARRFFVLAWQSQAFDGTGASGWARSVNLHRENPQRRSAIRGCIAACMARALRGEAAEEEAQIGIWG